LKKLAVTGDVMMTGIWLLATNPTNPNQSEASMAAQLEPRKE